MGVIQSEFSRDGETCVHWLVEHGGLGSPWSQFALRRYGTGVTATGVSSSVALPRLLRRRLQDWSVRGCGVFLGQNSVSFGRQLESVSRSGSELFFGVDIFFGDNSSRASWIWHCKPHEWLLQLHKAILEPLPTPPPAAPAAVGEQRFPGRPRFLVDGQEDSDMPEAGAEGASADDSTSPPRMAGPASASAALPREGSAAEVARAGGSEDASGASEVEDGEDAVHHQLSLYLTNSDGHVGLLCLPVPRVHVDMVTTLVAHWGETCEVPLVWAGRSWVTDADFAQLRESALNLPDVLLLGLETELAMALTPDWTWEKYPRGYGEAALPPEPPEYDAAQGEGAAEASRTQPVSAAA